MESARRRWGIPTISWAGLFAYLIGLNSPNFVVGYSGSELDIALARGELDGRINNADTLLRRNAESIAKGAIDLHAIMEVPKGLKQAGFERLPEFEDFAKTKKERRLLRMVRDFRQVGSPYVLPPGTQPERVKVLQEAMVKTFKDPEFHGEYKKLVGEEPTPVAGRNGKTHQRASRRSGNRLTVQENQRRRALTAPLTATGATRLSVTLRG